MLTHEKHYHIMKYCIPRFLKLNLEPDEYRNVMSLLSDANEMFKQPAPVGEEEKKLDMLLSEMSDHYGRKNDIEFEGNDLDEVLISIAKTTIKNNWFRTDDRMGGYHYFTNDELERLNEHLSIDEEKCSGGYCFLDEEGGSDGMIRLYAGECNPKWSFWKENNEVKCDLA